MDVKYKGDEKELSVESYLFVLEAVLLDQTATEWEEQKRVITWSLRNQALEWFISQHKKIKKKKPLGFKESIVQRFSQRSKKEEQL